eukprot:scaffold50346_cov55-Phaeocystis_antarctica.AAC.2
MGPWPAARPTPSWRARGRGWCETCDTCQETKYSAARLVSKGVWQSACEAEVVPRSRRTNSRGGCSVVCSVSALRHNN